MYCPQCGKENLEQPRFCKSCGLSLQSVALALAGKPLPSLVADAPVRQGRSRGGTLHSPVFYALLLILSGIIAALVFSPSGLHIEMAADIGGLIAILGVGLLGLKGVLLIVAPSQHERERVVSAPDEATTRLEPVALRGVERESALEETTRPLEPIPSKHS